MMQIDVISVEFFGSNHRQDSGGMYLMYGSCICRLVRWGRGGRGGWGLGGSAALMHLSLASPGVDPGTPQGLGGD